MLVLTRRVNESIVIDGDIVITVLEIGRNGQVRIGIEAPRHHEVYRRELWLEIQSEKGNAPASPAAPTAVDPGLLPPNPGIKTKRPTDEPTPPDKQPIHR